MAGLFKRLGKENGEKDTETKLYGSLRALRSPLRSASPAKRRSRSLEMPAESSVRQSTHIRQSSMQEARLRHSPSPAGRPLSITPSGALRRESALEPTSRPSTNLPPDAPTSNKKKRSSLFGRALNSLRHSAFSPGHSALSPSTRSGNNTPPSNTHSDTLTARPSEPITIPPPSLPEEVDEASTSGHSGTGTNFSPDPATFASRATAPEAETSRLSSSDASTALLNKAHPRTTHPSRHLPTSASEPQAHSDSDKSGSGHMVNSVSDPGPTLPILNIISATPPRRKDVDTEKYRDEAYQRLVKRERRKSPLAKIPTPRLFRRESAEVHPDSLLARVGSPILRVSTRDGERSAAPLVPSREAEFGASTSRTKVTLVGSAAQAMRTRQARHESFDFEQPSKTNPPAGGAAPPSDAKVRFVEPSTQDRGHDGDSGISGLGTDHEHNRENPEHPKRSYSTRRSSAQAPRSEGSKSSKKQVVPAIPPVAERGDAVPRDHSNSGLAPVGTKFSSHGLPMFSFESANPSPSPSIPSFSSRTNSRSDPTQSLISNRRQHKGRSLDLGIGLSWAPTKVREEAVLSFGNASRMGKSKWGVDARMSEVLREDNMQEFGVSPKQSIMQSFKQVLDEPGYSTFKLYCRRYEVGALPLEGPTGVLGHLERLLESASTLSPQARRQLLDRFSLFASSAR